MKAKYIKTINNGVAVQKLYELGKPMIISSFDGQYKSFDYIIASKVDQASIQEVMLFPADADGNILDWLDIGCVKGTPTIEYVMKKCGYDVV
jgi:hypothetical protein